MSRRRGALIAVITAVAAIALSAPAGLAAQAAAPALEVQQSSGTVEVLLPDLGWRQAVVGRPLPADSVLTSWIDSSAQFAFGGSTGSVGPLTDLRVLSVSDQLVKVTVVSGSLTVETSALPYEIEFRGMTIRMEQGKATLSDGVLSLESGNAVVSGAANTPLAVRPGSTLNLLARSEGPVFRGE